MTRSKMEPHFAITETPAFVGRAVAALAADSDLARWNGESLSSGQLAKVYGFTDLDGIQPDAWRYLVEVQDAGKPADVTGYRMRQAPGSRLQERLTTNEHQRPFTATPQLTLQGAGGR